MNETECLSRMVPPSRKRANCTGPWRGGVIQIWATRACDRACFGCTQGSNLGGKPRFITPEQFDVACQSLKDYFGVVGLFGGNPAIHPQFEELCRILRWHFDKSQCGLWCNNPLGKGAIMRETFNPACSNLNVHLDLKAFEEFKRDWPESRPFGLHEDSRHSPPFVAMKDVIQDEGRRWDLISRCPINQKWSAMIGVFRGELRAWFCEIAGSQSMLHQHEPEYPDTGLEVVSGWWKRGISDFAGQIRKHCHDCGVPLQGFGELSQSDTGVEQVSETHRAVFRPKKEGRGVEVVSDLYQLEIGKISDMTRYIQNSSIKE